MYIRDEKIKNKTRKMRKTKRRKKYIKRVNTIYFTVVTSSYLWAILFFPKTLRISHIALQQDGGVVSVTILSVFELKKQERQIVLYRDARVAVTYLFIFLIKPRFGKIHRFVFIIFCFPRTYYNIIMQALQSCPRQLPGRIKE